MNEVEQAGKWNGGGEDGPNLRHLENEFETAEHVTGSLHTATPAVQKTMESEQPEDATQHFAPLSWETLQKAIKVEQHIKLGQQKEAVQRFAILRRRIFERKANLELYSDNAQALPEGSIILGGQYRLLHLLHQRPRVNLYLAHRLCPQNDGLQQSEENKPLVAIRELVLTHLSPEVRTHIEAAAFEEFVSPLVLGSRHLPGAGDRVRVEGERHYLVMQLRGARGERQALAVTLTDLLLNHRQWPLWLDMQTALGWGIQLCRTVARLHRLGAIVGDLHPSTVLVDKQGATDWAPVLLPSWPPPPQFCLTLERNSSLCELYAQIFPIDKSAVDNAFVAPEMFSGICDERSDVYSLGAILYLLLTRYAPGVALIPPHLFNAHISSSLENVLLRALSRNPAQRYPSVSALIEALETKEEDGWSEPERPDRTSSQKCGRLEKESAKGENR